MKIYKQNNKLVIYLPYEVLENLNLTESDEVEFFKYSDKAFLFAKKSDIASMLAGQSLAQLPQARQAQQKNAPSAPSELSAEEIAVLKKLDTVRYSMRNEENIGKILNAREKQILDRLVDSKAVMLYKKGREEKGVYSIAKNVYDKFLMRKKQGQKSGYAAAPAPERRQQESSQYQKPELLPSDIEEIRLLNEQGYLVLNSEAEASSVSLSLESRISQGLILGTRGFNKKYYIVKRPFIDKYTGAIFKLLGEGEKKVSVISESLNVEEEAARGILYILAENGTIREKRRDLFAKVD